MNRNHWSYNQFVTNLNELTRFIANKCETTLHSPIYINLTPKTKELSINNEDAIHLLDRYLFPLLNGRLDYVIHTVQNNNLGIVIFSGQDIIQKVSVSGGF